tara:strand:- start:1187 stop:2032 length:846 start_codon:yes stop_codon:yes gene_type:complete
MKKLLFILILLPIITNAQYTNPYSQPVKVEIVPKSSYSNPRIITAQPQPNPYKINTNQIYQNAAAGRAANAANRSASTAAASAQSEALRDNYEKIQIDKLKGNTDQYKYLAIKKVSGWMVLDNFLTIRGEIKKANKYTLVSENNLKLYKDKKGRIRSNDYKMRKLIPGVIKSEVFEPKIPEEYLGNSETLFLEWTRDNLTSYDRFSRLILKNSSGETVYQAEFKNKGYSEMLMPVLSDYIFGKEDAKKELIELKEYLDLGIITQEEFDEKAMSLKKILLGN